jgi:hypothetical protein
MQKAKSESNKALALIFVVAILMMLSLMGITFLHLATLERSAATNASYAIQVGFGVEAGMELAVSKLYDCFRHDRWYESLTSLGGPMVPVWYYGGKDVNASGKLDSETCSLAEALVPSFMAGEEHGIGYSSKMTLGSDSLLSSLKVSDLSARLPLSNLRYEAIRDLSRTNLRSPVPPASSEDEKPPRPGMERMIYTLVQLLGEDPRYKNLPLAQLPEYLNRLMARDSFSQEDVVNTLPPELADLAQYFTAYSWLNPSTIKPPFTAGEVTPEVAAPEKLAAQWQAGKTPRLPQPIRYTKMMAEPRAPVNINSSDYPVLVACLNGLSARVVRPGFLSKEGEEGALAELNKHLNSATQKLVADAQNQPDRLEEVHLGLESARYLANEIIAERRRKPFASWQDFALFLKNLVAAQLKQNEPKLTAQQAMLVWANANPNTGLNKFAPDFPDSYLYSLFRSVPDNGFFYRIDKTDLIVYTTEFCFAPTGYFAIASLSRIVSSSGQVIAQSPQRSAIVQVFDQYSLTSQRDFTEQLAQSSGIATYPEAPDQAKICYYDGYLGLSAQAFKTPSEYPQPPTFAQPIAANSQWQGVDPGPLTGQDTGNVYGDGVFSFAGNSLARPSAIPEQPKNEQPAAKPGELPPSKTTLLCFWYKPDWNIMDPWARPHSLFDSNSAEVAQLFQIYNDSKSLPLLSGVLVGDRATVRLFAWDRGSGLRPGKPIQLGLPLPDGISQNRWIFFALYWNEGKIRLGVNQSRAEITKDVSFIELLFAERINENTIKSYIIIFVAENPTKQIKQSQNPRCVGYYTMNQEVNNNGIGTGKRLSKEAFLPSDFVGPGISTSSKNVQHTKSWSKYFTKNLRSGSGFSNFSAEDEYYLEGVKTVPGSQKLFAELYSTHGVIDRNIEKEKAIGQVLQLLDSAEKQIPGIRKIFFGSFPNNTPRHTPRWNAYPTIRIGEFVTEFTDEGLSYMQKVLSSSSTGANLTLDAEVHDIHLGGKLKFIAEPPATSPATKPAPTPQQIWLTCPANGTYANVAAYELKGKSDEMFSQAEEMSSAFYLTGRYQGVGESKPCYRTRVLPLTSGSGPFHLGALRWTQYRPQDCVDFAAQGNVATVNVEMTLCDAKGQRLAGPLLQADSSMVDCNADDVCLDVRFSGDAKPVLSTPVVDDVTLTYSRGVRYVEVR